MFRVYNVGAMVDCRLFCVFFPAELFGSLNFEVSAKIMESAKTRPMYSTAV